MRIRWRSGVCGLSVTALALAGAGLAGAAGGGSYRGSTSQRQPVSLTVSSGAVRNFKIRILDKCPDGHILRVRAGFTSPMAITNGTSHAAVTAANPLAACAAAVTTRPSEVVGC